MERHNCHKRIYKRCFVPNCFNNIKRTPEKWFVPVPKGPIRAQWFTAAGRAEQSLSSGIFCCQDHFDEKDVLNIGWYHTHRRNRNVKIRLREGTIPSKFDCQKLTAKEINEGRPAPCNKKLLQCCIECPGLFTTPSVYNKHIRNCEIRKNSPTVNSCTFCSQQFKDASSLIAHIESQHKSDNKYYCPACNEYFRYEFSLKDHLRAHQEKKPLLKKEQREVIEITDDESDLEYEVLERWKCQICNVDYKSEPLFNLHIWLSRGKCVIWKCYRCHGQFESQAALAAHSARRHLKTPSTRQIHKCPICRITFPSLYVYTVHIRDEHSMDPALASQSVPPLPLPPLLQTPKQQETTFECFYCKEKLKRRSLLIEHMKNHTYLFKCPLCSLSFHNEEDRELHSVQHTAPPPQES